MIDDSHLTMADRYALGALQREPRLDQHQPPLHPTWLAAREEAGFLVVGETAVVVHPTVATWFDADGALRPEYAIWQPITVTLEWDADDEASSPWVTGYTDGSRWNGSVVPLLPADAVRTLLDRVGPYSYDADADAFVITPAGTDTADRFVGRAVMVAPGAAPVTLYQVDGWIWVEAEAPV